MFTPSTGKVVSIENSPNPLRSGSRQTAQADIAATDSVATASSGSTTDSATTSSPGATGDSGNQVVSGTGSDSAIAVVSEASAAISDVVDPDNLSVATTTAQVSAADSGSGGFFGADPVSGGGSPEPSTMLMAGSMFLGWGLFLAARRKRA